MKTSLTRLLGIVIVSIFSCAVVAQVSTGTPPLGSFSSGPDVTNLGNLNVHFVIPVINKPGRGMPFFYNLDFDSSIWSPTSSSGTATWTPVGNWGWRGETDAVVGYVNLDIETTSCRSDDGTTQHYTVYLFQAYVDEFGTTHNINGRTDTKDQANCISGGGTATEQVPATDGSGLTFNLTNDPDATVIMRDGSQFHPPLAIGRFQGSVTDRNGNQITTTSGASFTDTLGMTALSISGSAPKTFTYTDSSGTARSVTLNYSTYTVQTSFGCSGISEYGPVATSLVSSVALPDGTSYSFTYEQTPGGPIGNVTGRLKSITLRTGGTISYAYTGGNNGIICGDGSTAGFNRTTSDGTTTYARSGSGTAWITTITDAQNNQTTINFQTAQPNALAGASAAPNFYETHRTVKQGTSTVLRQFDICYQNIAPPCINTAIGFPIPAINRYSTLDNNQIALSATNLNSFGLPVSSATYDFGNAPYGAKITSRTITYANLGNNIVFQPATITAFDGGGAQIAQTTFGYDETSPTATSGVPQHIAITGSRGNRTSVQQWVNTNNSNLTTILTYDDTGNVLTSTDPAGHQTQFSYADNFGDGINRNSLAYATQVTMPDTNSPNLAHHITKAQYDANTGLALKTWDQNDQQTSISYDALFRPLQVSFPDGGMVTNIYTGGANSSVETDSRMTSTTNLVSTIYFDGLGRSTQLAHNDPAGTDSTESTYDSLGRVSTVRNVHRAGASDTDGTTQYHFDALGRLTGVNQPDGASTTVSYSGNQVTYSDEAGYQHTQVSDALGRTTSVVEDPSGFNYETDYTYNALNDLLTVNQKGSAPNDSTQWRTRTFAYDSLSRLTQSTTPEQGTIAYGYDSNGNLTSRVAPAPNQTGSATVTTTYTYDALNRLTQQSYSDGTTPTVTYQYDTANNWGVTQSNLIGRLAEIYENGTVPGDQIFGYDSMGRVVVNNQCTPANCGTSAYSVSAQYDLAGNLILLQYPSGRSVGYGYNSAGWMNSVQFTQYGGSAPVGGTYTYWSAADANFYPSGAAKTGTLGNGVVQTLSSNNRLQMSEMAITNPQMGTFDDHTMNYSSSGVGSSNNNGSVYNITDKLNSSLTQNFTYDHLNRVATAGETGNRWGLSFGYDAWNNFLQQTVTAGSAGARSDAADTHNRLIGRSYDAAGNTTNDGAHQYVYDAEGRVISVDNGSDSYAYAASGARVRKTVGGVSRDYIYFGGQILAMKNADGTWQDYIPGPGGQIARTQDYDKGLRIFGTRCSNCGSQYMDYYLGNAGGLNNYVVRSGDKLYFTQYEPSGTHGGLIVFFSDGTTSNWSVKDKEGYFLNDDQASGSTHFRTVDLSSFAGKTITNFAANQESDTAGGAFFIVYEQIVLVSSDGKVQPVYTGQNASPVSSIGGTSGVTGTGSQIDTNQGKAIYPQPTTVYFHTDQLGSSQLLTSGYSYPIWQGTFLPYGQEYTPQLEIDNFKFTGLEHDDETGLDHASFRQYSGSNGRWSTPDPYQGSMDLTNPQSLNRYAYVLNNPVNFTDPLGLWCGSGDHDDCMFGYLAEMFGGDDGGGGFVGGGGGCTVNGADAPCSLALGLVNSGTGAICPNGDCSKVRVDPGSGNWQIFISWPGENYTTPKNSDTPDGFFLGVTTNGAWATITSPPVLMGAIPGGGGLAPGANPLLQALKAATRTPKATPPFVPKPAPELAPQLREPEWLKLVEHGLHIFLDGIDHTLTDVLIFVHTPDIDCVAKGGRYNYQTQTCSVDFI